MKYAYLQCVDISANSNKFYEMRQISRHEFVAKWGREGHGSPRSKTFPMHSWDSVYNKRVNKRNKKSYTDITAFKQVPVVKSASNNSFIDTIADADIRELIQLLHNHATGSVAANYEISSEIVTPAMVDQAQRLLTTLSNRLWSHDGDGMTNNAVNAILEEVFTVIPRQMARVSNHVLEPNRKYLDLIHARQLLEDEQANLDVMAQQARSSRRDSVRVSSNEVGLPGQTLLEQMGTSIRVATGPEIDAVTRLTRYNKNRIRRVFAVSSTSSRKTYREFIESNLIDNPNRHQLWHGSRTENWLAILELGLLVRPPGARTTGSMFGFGIYFADKFQKSHGYTSHRGSHYAHGTGDVGYMGVFNVALGKQLEVGRWQQSHGSLNFDTLNKWGYNSVWGKSGGGSLINNEYIIYTPAQCTMAYLVEFS